MVLKALDNWVSEERLTSRFRSQGGPHSDLLSSLARPLAFGQRVREEGVESGCQPPGRRAGAG